MRRPPPFCGRAVASYRFCHPEVERPGARGRRSGSMMKRAYAPALRGSPSPSGPTTPSPRSASIRSRRRSREGRSMGSDRARRPPALSATNRRPPPEVLDPTNRKGPRPRLIRIRRKKALGISVGSAPAPLPAGSVHSGIRPRSRRGPPILRVGQDRRWGSVESVRGSPSPPGPTTPSPRSRLHPVEADVEGGGEGRRTFAE